MMDNYVDMATSYPDNSQQEYGRTYMASEDTIEPHASNLSVGSDLDMSQTSTNKSDMLNGLKIIYEPYELVWSPHTVFRVTMIVVVMVLTIIGNTALITIIMYHPKLRRKRVNVFLVNLAIGDLMVCFVTMTTEILFVAFGEWVLGAVSCKLMVYGQIVTLASATFLLTGMSIDRYQVIVKPLQSLRGQPKIWRKVLVAWILALIFAAPQLFIFVQTEEGVHEDGKIKYMCKSKGYTAEWQRKLYFTFMASYILVIPTIIMSFCYTNIIKVVWMRTGDPGAGKVGDSARRQFTIRFNFRQSRGASMSKPHSVDAMLERRQPERTSILHNNMCVPKKLMSASKRNVIKMTLTVIIGFVVCWTPYFVTSLIRIYSDYTIKIPKALSVAEIMALVHSALNPILYGMFSTKAARRLCSKICKCCSIATHGKCSPPETIVSEDDTCSSVIETKRYSVNLKNKRLTVVLQEPAEPWYARLQSRLNKVFCRRNKRKKRPSHSPDSNIPLLIYGKVMNGHSQLRTSSSSTSATQDKTTEVPQQYGRHQDMVSSPTSQAPSVYEQQLSVRQGDKLCSDALVSKGNANNMENDGDQVEYLSML